MLGPLVVAGFLTEGVDPLKLVTAGAGDSKKMSASRRMSVRAALSDLGTADLREITPSQIDDGNLNTLEEDAIVDLIRQCKPDVVRVDALGHPSAIPRILARLEARVAPVRVSEWLMEPKADDTWPVVGAASVFAKTTRDARLAEVEATHGPLGSGYPSDPVTRRWLEAWSREGKPWPDFVRTRWQTVTALSQRALF